MKKAILFFVIITLMFASCKKKHQEPTPQPTTGTVSGKVTNSSSQGISGAQVIVFNANTNAPIGVTTATGADGSYSISLPAGTYYIKIYSQGYQSVPPPGMSAIPFTISPGNTTTSNLQMIASTVTNGGWITGNVSVSGAGKSGVLIIAHSGSNGYSSVSDASGNYTIYNVPAASGYTVNAFIVGFNSDSVQSVTVAQGAVTSNINLNLAAGATGSVTGSIQFNAVTGKQVDVSLVNPYTKETIPGLSTFTTGSQFTYTFSNVPNGLYLGRASFKNDSIVTDPEWIYQHGQPYVTVSGGSATLNFTCTNSIVLNSPTNVGTSIVPVTAGATPTFTWTAYPSTSKYAIEVSDANGTIVWGGFTGSGSAYAPVITTTSTSILYAGPSLSAGQIYRWRIYALKNVQSPPAGSPNFSFISSSEEQMGLITP
jgi:hypothetical protein